jgi:hypothetical protein
VLGKGKERAVLHIQVRDKRTAQRKDKSQGGETVSESSKSDYENMNTNKS